MRESWPKRDSVGPLAESPGPVLSGKAYEGNPVAGIQAFPPVHLLDRAPAPGLEEFPPNPGGDDPGIGGEIQNAVFIQMVVVVVGDEDSEFPDGSVELLDGECGGGLTLGEEGPVRKKWGRVSQYCPFKRMRNVCARSRPMKSPFAAETFRRGPESDPALNCRLFSVGSPGAEHAIGSTPRTFLLHGHPGVEEAAGS